MRAWCADVAALVRAVGKRVQGGNLLENMFVGRPPGNYDRLLDFSEAVSGNLFFVPPASLPEALAERRPGGADTGEAR